MALALGAALATSAHCAIVTARLSAEVSMMRRRIAALEATYPERAREARELLERSGR